MYSKGVYLSEKTCAGVELVASAKGISIKAATDLLVLAGVSKVTGDLVLAHIEIQKENERRAAAGPESSKVSTANILLESLGWVTGETNETFCEKHV